ncbi:hypothetical protein [Nitratireductor sp. GZWM139]|uniref:hypothetical protein n=1 Tax=Nitratireductor sp. GZWM139 TaxID=2950541 RepID=UPI0024BDE6EB|nr:hypothetical protein [Nitratireductor sp. GZWM139]MDJ1463717.1 hypothetical protein [Nitratireductor sp. GZWM139]
MLALQTFWAQAGEWSVPGRNPPSLLVFAGAIVEGDAAKLAQMVSVFPTVSTVMLSSPGGDLREGLVLADLIDRLGLNTIVMSGLHCESACAVAFMGGKERIAQKGAIVGVHAPYRERDKSPFAMLDGVGMMSRSVANIEIRKYLAEFARKKGISSIVVDWMFVSSQPAFTKKITASDGLRMRYSTRVVE